MTYPTIGTARLLEDEGGVMLEVAVPDIATTFAYFGAASVVQFQSASSPTGSFSDLTTVALVSGETFYRYEHAAGTVATWYRHRYEASNGTDVSAWSTVYAVSPYRLTFQACRQELAKEMGLYTNGTTTAAGSTSTVVDSSKIVSISNTNQWKGGWLKMTSGSASGEVRNISDYAITTGTFTVTPVLSAGSGSGSTYEVYRDISPTDLDEAINDALQLLLVEDDYVFAADKTTNYEGRREYQLPYTVARTAQVIGLDWHQSWGAVTGERVMANWLPLGTGEWQVMENNGVVSVRLHVLRGENSVYRVRYRRPYISAFELRVASDATTVGMPLKDVITAAKYQAYDRLVMATPPNAKPGEWEKRREAARKSWYKLLAQYYRRSSPLFEQEQGATVEW